MKKPLSPKFYFRLGDAVFPAQTLPEVIANHNIWASHCHSLQACPVGTCSWIPASQIPGFATAWVGHFSESLHPDGRPAPPSSAPLPPRAVFRGFVQLALACLLLLGLILLAFALQADPTVMDPVSRRMILNLPAAHTQTLHVLLSALLSILSLLGLVITSLPRQSPKN